MGRTVSLTVDKTSVKIKHSLILVLILVIASAVVPNRAEAQPVDPSIVDSDGYVPIYEVCLPADPLEGEVGGGYLPYDDGFGGVAGLIILNMCALEALGAGPNDIAYVIAHEMGHARGLLHSDDPNSLMYPGYPITGT